MYDGRPKVWVTVSDLGDTKSMSRGIKTGFAVVAALACAAAAFYWLHSRRAPVPPAMASATPSMPLEAGVTSNTGPETTVAAPGRAAAKKAEHAADAGLLLRPGEALEYSANVSKLSNVASLKLQVAERRNFFGKNAWHLQAFAHTENPLRMVFELDDQFDSYSDAGTMTCLQYEMRLSERGQKVQSIQRMTATGKEPAPPDATATRVLPGTRDPLGLMQYLRNVDWTKTPEVRSPVYDGQKLYEVRAKSAGDSQEVSVPAGSYKTSKIEIRVFQNGAEMKDANFSLYLANNESRTPVLLEAVLPFATARVELQRVQ